MNIEDFCKNNGLGNVVKITKLVGGLMHKMFKVETDSGIYAIKILNREVIGRDNAYSNFAISETISNFARENGIKVSSALKIDGNYLTKFDDNYYMVFNFVEGKVLTDTEINLEYCKKIGHILAHIHSLDYTKLDLNYEKVDANELYDWDSYIKNLHFAEMSYRDKFLENYKKYNSILERTNERFNIINTDFCICHRDMDLKNVMWNDGEAIIIDWEAASLSNPYIELVEVALCWSGFLTDNFDKNKFRAVISEYSKTRNIANIDWYFVICGNLISRFQWLKYNLERSLGICSREQEEIKIAEKEVSKAIDEINKYLELIGTMYNTFYEDELTVDCSCNYDNVISKIIDNNSLFKGKDYSLITAGFTNTIYKVDNYIVRICTNKDNEEHFKNEIDFYSNNKSNSMIPKLYYADISYDVVSYYYEIMEYVYGITMYEVWYKFADEKRLSVIKSIINILKSFHKTDVLKYDFCKFIKDKLELLIRECELDEKTFDLLLDKCELYFKDNKFGLIHGDLHFDNIIYNDGYIKLLDFEACMVAPIDYEFRIFNRYSETPYLWASAKADMLTVKEDYKDFMKMIIDNYDELRDISYLEERLSIYLIIDILCEYKNNRNKKKLDKIMSEVNSLIKK